MSEFKFTNIKPDKNYERLSTGDVFTGRQLRALLGLASPVVQAIILLDIWETTDEPSKPGTKYGV